MGKTTLEVQFILPIENVSKKHQTEATKKAKAAFVLELLRQGAISAGRAAKLLNISRWELSELMAEAGISPFDDSLTAETLQSEVDNALKDFEKSTPGRLSQIVRR